MFHCCQIAPPLAAATYVHCVNQKTSPLFVSKSQQTQVYFWHFQTNIYNTI